MQRGAWGQGLGLGLLALVSVWAVLCLLPPALTSGASADEFSAARALAQVRRIASEPRPVGSAAHERTRAYLVDTLTRWGLEVRVQPTHFASLMAGNLVSSDVHNVIARLRGTGSAQGAVLLAAHYDSVPAGPGASDDGFGVAVLLETARALAASPKMPRDVLFLFSDAEEEGLLGAQAFVAEASERPEIGVALNFDARGTHGAVTMFATSANNAALIRALGQAAPRPIASSFISTLAAALPNDTDASVFARAGIPTYSFAYADGLEHYHRFTDTPSALDPRSLAHGGSYALAMARYFGSSELSALAGGDQDSVYFDLFGRWLARYSKTAARCFASATLLLLALGLRASRAHNLSFRAVFRELGAAVLGVLSAALVALVLGLVLAQWVPLYFLMARVEWFVAAVSLAAAAALVFLFGRRANIAERDARAYGSALLFFLILAPLAIFLPALSPPFQWPLFFALLGVVVSRSLARNPLLAALTRFALLGPACFILMQMTYATLVATGATLPVVPALFVSLFLVLLLPAVEGLSRARAAKMALILAISSLILGGLGVVSSHHSPEEPSAGSLDYGLDQDTGKAVWFTRDARPDPRVAQRVAPDSARVPLPAFTRSDEALLATPALAVERAPARVEVTSNQATTQGRTLELEVRASADARCWQLWQEPSSSAPSIAQVHLDGAPVPSFVRFSAELDAKLMRMATADRSRLGWHMSYCGAGARSVKVSLQLLGHAALVLRLLEKIDGFPENFRTSEARGAASFGPEQDSDVSLFSRSFEL